MEQVVESFVVDIDDLDKVEIMKVVQRNIENHVYSETCTSDVHWDTETMSMYGKVMYQDYRSFGKNMEDVEIHTKATLDFNCYVYPFNEKRVHVIFTEFEIDRENYG